ncbi:zinc metalloprotease [Nonomuraea dietziae]|uniref:zinc metalloprotease n=1 Tax=Nonomuraea dietziae TaxID=65515 RepID=UPI0033EFA5B0
MARRTTAAALVCLLAAWPLVLAGAPATAAGGCSPASRNGRGDAHPEPVPVTAMLADLASRDSPSAVLAAPIAVPLWVHVLTDGARRAPDEAVTAQVEALNAAYAGTYGGVDTNVRFHLQGVTVTAKAEWFANPLAHETEMKTELRRGGADTLNLYIGQLAELVLGYSTYPFWYTTAPHLDGVVIDWRSLPGGSLADFDRGFTSVHEIGHWLGLFHTFENGCEAPGDGVEDTPPQAGPTVGCPEGQDTCSAPGADPIHNFMDYTHDRCMSEFTQGQVDRMHEMWLAYRAQV